MKKVLPIPYAFTESWSDKRLSNFRASTHPQPKKVHQPKGFLPLNEFDQQKNGLEKRLNSIHLTKDKRLEV